MFSFKCLFIYSPVVKVYDVTLQNTLITYVVHICTENRCIS